MYWTHPVSIKFSRIFFAEPNDCKNLQPICSDGLGRQLFFYQTVSSVSRPQEAQVVSLGLPGWGNPNPNGKLCSTHPIESCSSDLSIFHLKDPWQTTVHVIESCLSGRRSFNWCCWSRDRSVKKSEYWHFCPALFGAYILHGGSHLFDNRRYFRSVELFENYKQTFSHILIYDSKRICESDHLHRWFQVNVLCMFILKRIRKWFGSEVFLYQTVSSVSCIPY